MRVLRVLEHARESMTVRELARRAGEHLRAVQLTVGRLVEGGVVERVGTGGRQQVGFNVGHPLALALQALFEAERTRFERILSRLKLLAREHANQAAAVWVIENPASDPAGLEVGVLAASGAVDALVDALRESVADVLRGEDVAIEVRGWTRPDLDALGRPHFSQHEHPIVLRGLLPAEHTALSVGPRAGRRSHRAVDEALRERARRVAAEIARRPELVRAARDEVAARLATAPPQEARTLREWRQVLDSMSAARLCRWLAGPGERAARLRQSMPVVLLRAPSDPTGAAGLCLEANDLAASKLAAWRDKDREFVRLLLRDRLIKPTRLVRLINLMPLPEERRAMLRQWVDGTEREIALGRVKPHPR